MRVALCTTTIHVPHALKLLRTMRADIKFFVAADKKTPQEAYELCESMVNCRIIGPEAQGRWKCSEALGWNVIARRNIAFLEALADGADVIYSHDDDNIPVGPDMFSPYGPIGLMHNVKFNGIKVTGNDGWFDPGALLIPATRHRGFPHAHRVSTHAHPVTGARIGVAAGLVIGDPDIDSVTRMERHPDIGSVHILGSAGIVVDLGTWTVFNSQNTAVVRELIPAWFMMPGVGRHDDIYASLIVQRVARERGLHVHFGQPFCYQQRNEHDLMVDLRAEIDGMENVQKLAALLDSIQLTGKSVIEDTRAIYDTLLHCDFIPAWSVLAALQWLEDCEGVI